MSSASLNAARRKAEIEHLGNGIAVDLVVIGGGITGCGIALDAATRGLSVALVERHDLAHGTSRWSSKLIHGGLRYLRHLEFAVAWESARERRILMTTTAPHLVRPLPFVVPLNDACRPMLGVMSEAGIRTGDALRFGAGSRRRDLPRARRIPAMEALQLAPAVARPDLRGALLFWDGQVEDDARLVVGIARTAAQHGARILTRCAAEGVERGRVHCRDAVTGGDFTIRTDMIINATGVWAGEIDPLVRLQPSKGVHLIVRAADLGFPRAAVLTPVEGESARWVGATPCSDGRVIIGVTDDPHDGPVEDEPGVEVDEERFLLSVLSQALRAPITSDAVIGRFAGYRPLVAGGGGGSTADLSRHDSITDNPALGMTTIVGGKLTTYRHMAERTLDHVLATHGRTPPPCRTAHLPLVGAAERSVLRGVRAPERLVRRYGTEAAEIIRDADPADLEPIPGAGGACVAELTYAVAHEGALDVDDVLDRRLRLGLVPEERAAAEAVARRVVDEAAA